MKLTPEIEKQIEEFGKKLAKSLNKQADGLWSPEGGMRGEMDRAGALVLRQVKDILPELVRQVFEEEVRTVVRERITDRILGI